jgi:hypothetical protein
MSQISLDPTVAKKLDMGMRAGENIELPFPVVYIWALNGQASYKSQGGALYYGGWAAKAEDLQTTADQQGLALPKDWKLVTITSRDGGEFEAYTSRSAIVAPIGKRVSWLLDGKRYAEYVEGGRRHLQVLAYLAETQGENGSKQFIPWGPVVLTAKGYQARNLLDAFARWNKATAQIRWKVAPGVPAWCFYLAIGTYGKERHVVSVGKPGAQSPITPISAYIHENFSEELISSLFVGEEMAARMVELQEQANDWLNGWNEAGQEENTEDYQAYEPEEEEIPF